MRIPSIPPLRGTIRVSLAVAALGVGLACMAPAHAQNQPTAPDLRLAPAELEIHKVSSTSELKDYTVDLQILVGARNNGKGPGAFDYALGTSDLRYVYFTAKGALLAGGQVHANAFRVPFKTVLTASGGGTPSSLVEVCYGLFLVKAGSKTGWTDSNNPNHRKQVCTKVRIPPS
jgi:hypothetical protein